MPWVSVTATCQIYSIGAHTAVRVAAAAHLYRHPAIEPHGRRHRRCALTPEPNGPRPEGWLLAWSAPHLQTNGGAGGCHSAANAGTLKRCCGATR